MKAGKGSPNYGTGRASHAGGYVRVRHPGHPLAGTDGYVLEHRFVLYESGLDPRGHHVHHKNGNKLDNRLENLELMPASEHHREHIAKTRQVTNQFGTFGLWRDRGGHEAEREANRVRCRNYQQRIRAPKQQEGIT